MTTSKNIMLVAGARPNFIKIASLYHALRHEQNLTPYIVHTGQHYDRAMSDVFFADLDMPPPDVNLNAGSGTHAVQTAEIMLRFEPVLDDVRPACVAVVGDVNSTIACGLTAVKKDIPLAHVEAGLRSRDRTMPEEINRLATDAISDLLFCTEASAVNHLLQEGRAEETVHMVGNVMIDSLLRVRDALPVTELLAEQKLKPGTYRLLTLHRPSNVDEPEKLAALISAVCTLAEEEEMVFPLHPRTKAGLERSGLYETLKNCEQVRLLDPVGYRTFIALLEGCTMVLTDSGGLQEEACILRKPCVTIREQTERPVTVDCGGNIIAGCTETSVLNAARQAALIRPEDIQTPPLWDGHAAERISTILNDCYA